MVVISILIFCILLCHTLQKENKETELTDLHQTSDTPFHCETGSLVTPDQIEDWLNYIKLNQFRSNYIKSNELNVDNNNEEIIFEDADLEENGCTSGKKLCSFFF